MDDNTDSARLGLRPREQRALLSGRCVNSDRVTVTLTSQKNQHTYTQNKIAHN